MKNIGEVLRQLRMDKGLSQRKLASISGVSNAEISRIESGIRDNINERIIYKLLKVLEPTDKMNELSKEGLNKLYELSEVRKKISRFNIDRCVRRYIENLIEKGWGVEDQDDECGIVYLRKESGALLNLKLMLGHSVANAYDMRVLIKYYIMCIECNRDRVDRYIILVDNKEAYELYKNEVNIKEGLNVSLEYVGEYEGIDIKWC